ncbi:hypothetical protein P3G55_15585 [Leptospira sp. 96542]|nr:hypothetical protein [Leptospira sp. 96542]
MKRYKTYKRLEPPYFRWSNSLQNLFLFAVALSILSYPILYFFGILPLFVFTTIISLIVNVYYHGLKNAYPNGAMSIPNRNIPFIIILFSMIPSFFVIFFTLTIVSFGSYTFVSYQKSGVFNFIWFILWCFIVFGLPSLYLLGFKIKYWFGRYYQAYHFTPIQLYISYDPELQIHSLEISFINKNKSLLCFIKNDEFFKPKNDFSSNPTTIAEKNDFYYGFVSDHRVYIPKHTDIIKIKYISASENSDYSGEIAFSYNKLKFERNKYPLNEFTFLRGWKTSPIVLTIGNAGKIHISNQDGGLEILNQLGLIDQKYNLSLKQKQSESQTKKQQLRDKVRFETFNWQLTGKGTEGHTVYIKNGNYHLGQNDTFELGKIFNLPIPIRFEFTYFIYSWCFIHVYPEELYEILQQSLANTPNTVFTFHFDTNLKIGDISLIIKSNNNVLPFTAWQKEIITQHLEDAKNKLKHESSFRKNKKRLEMIYNLIQKKEYTKAEKICKKAIENDPNFALFYFYEARLVWYLKGYVESYLKKEYFIEKTIGDNYALSRIYNHYGCLLDDEGRYKESLYHFELAAKTYPEEVIYTANIAEIYHKMNQNKKAVQYARICTDRGYTSAIISEILKQNP